MRSRSDWILSHLLSRISLNDDLDVYHTSLYTIVLAGGVNRGEPWPWVSRSRTVTNMDPRRASWLVWNCFRWVRGFAEHFRRHFWTDNALWNPELKLNSSDLMLSSPPIFSTFARHQIAACRLLAKVPWNAINNVSRPPKTPKLKA